MKKIITLLVMSFTLITIVNGQLIKNDFLDGFQVGDPIESGDLADQSPLIDSWALSTNNRDGANPLAAAALTYSGYEESDKDVSIDMQSLTTGFRTSIYGIAPDGRYTTGGTPYYLAFMHKVTDVVSASDRKYLWLDKAYGSNLGVQLTLKREEVGKTYNIGLSDGSTATYYGTPLNVGETYLFVLKFTDSAVSLFINPTLGEAEPTEPTFEIASTRQSSFRSLAVRQMAGFSAQVGGFRLAYTWADAVKGEPTGLRNIEKNSDLIKILGKDIVTEKAGKLSVYNTLGAIVFQSRIQGRLTTDLSKGIYIIHFEGEDGVQLSSKMIVNF